MKPRLIRCHPVNGDTLDFGWNCRSPGQFWFGATPKQAFANWKHWGEERIGKFEWAEGVGTPLDVTRPIILGAA